MPDITMCSSGDCGLKDKCYRSTAKPSSIQYFSNFYTEKKCEYFLDNGE